MPPRSHAATDIVGTNSSVTTMTRVHLLVRICVCVSVCVSLHAFICRFLPCLAAMWNMMRLCSLSNRCPPPPPLPPNTLLSFLRKLIGGCHWCVKLLCVGCSRQLDYLFFIFSILEPLPSALLLLLNEIYFTATQGEKTHWYSNCSNHHVVLWFDSLQAGELILPI